MVRRGETRGVEVSDAGLKVLDVVGVERVVLEFVDDGEKVVEGGDRLEGLGLG
jgi:hypothetical protein